MVSCLQSWKHKNGKGRQDETTRRCSQARRLNISLKEFIMSATETPVNVHHTVSPTSLFYLHFHSLSGPQSQVFF